MLMLPLVSLDRGIMGSCSPLFALKIFPELDVIFMKKCSDKDRQP